MSGLDLDLTAAPDFSLKELFYTKPVPKSGLPFLPKTCKVHEKLRVW